MLINDALYATEKFYNACRLAMTLQNEHSEHMGLSIIRERAALINAAINIDSQPGGGTQLTLVWHN